jgi:hypothetical protein
MDVTTKQLVKENRSTVPAEPGIPVRYDYEYERNGVCNLFMFYKLFSGEKYVSITVRRANVDWALQITDLLDNHCHNVRKEVLVMDNINTHTGASLLYEAFEPDEPRVLLGRLEMHYTPKYGSWLNIVEMELRVLTGQCLNRRIPEKQKL